MSMHGREQLKVQALLAGQHDWMLPLFAPEDDCRPAFACARITEEAVLAPLLDRFASLQDGAPRNAVVSLWSQYYFATLCLPLMASALACGENSVAIGQSAILMDESGKPAAVKITRGCAGPKACETPLDPVLDDHLCPLATTLAKLGGLSEKVIWGNAAHYLEWFIGWLGTQGSLPEATRAGLRHCLERDRLPDGRPNPLKGAIRYEGGQAATDPQTAAGAPDLRRRKVCCLRYVIPGMVTCGGLCPRPEIRAQARLQ